MSGYREHKHREDDYPRDRRDDRERPRERSHRDDRPRETSINDERSRGDERDRRREDRSDGHGGDQYYRGHSRDHHARDQGERHARGSDRREDRVTGSDERAEHRHKDRDQRSRSRSPTRHRKHRSPTPRSGSGSETDSSSEDSSEEERRRRKRKKEKKRDKESKEDRKARKERKKEKKLKKKSRKTAAVTSQWGTYGIISEADQESKGSEFRSWLVEERKINPETVDKHKEKKEFARFVEDYNTATLPSEKYYDMAKYEIKMKMVREGEGAGLMEMFGAAGGSSYDPLADEKAHSTSLKRAPVETDSFLNRAQLEELRKIQVERTEVQRRKVMGMDVPKNLGVRSEEKNKLYK